MLLFGLGFVTGVVASAAFAGYVLWHFKQT